MTASAVIGLLVLLAAPQLTRGLAVADAALSRRLLGPRRDLAARVTELEISRERVVDAAEAERRRIERDLHDGAQQRLVALAMDLGRAKAQFADDPEAPPGLVDQAHDAGQGGPHRAAQPGPRRAPAGARPSAAWTRRCPAWPRCARSRCDVHVDVPVRPKSAVEAVAYFMVAEALTNVAKHSRASQAKVVVEAHGYPGTLTVMVSDDGIGGADAHGPGLSGLADRVVRGGRAALGGVSPSGGPTDHRGGTAMRVVIAEDSVLLREGLTRLLTEAGHEVAAAEGDAEKFLRAVAAHRPDVVVVDVRMPPTFTDEGLRAALVVRRPLAGHRRARPLPVGRGAVRHRADLPGARTGSATCSRTGSRTSPSSSTRCTGWPRAAARSIPRSSRSCSPAAATRSASSPRASARCSR